MSDSGREVTRKRKWLGSSCRRSRTFRRSARSPRDPLSSRASITISALAYLDRRLDDLDQGCLPVAVDICQLTRNRGKQMFWSCLHLSGGLEEKRYASTLSGQLLGNRLCDSRFTTASNAVQPKYGFGVAVKWLGKPLEDFGDHIHASPWITLIEVLSTTCVR